jgi:hypothetical protein
MIVAFNVFLFPGDYNVLKDLAKQVYETDWMSIECVDPEQSDGIFSEAKFALLVGDGDGWVAHVEMYREDEDEKYVRLAVWHKDGVEVEEDYISTFPLNDLSTDNPEIVCDEQDICGAKVWITYKKLRIYATIFIDFDKNVPKKVIEIAIKGSAMQKTQIVVSR